MTLHPVDHQPRGQTNWRSCRTFWPRRRRPLVPKLGLKGRLDSTPESDPIPQADKGGIFMKHRNLSLSRLWERVLRVKGSPLARLYRLCCGIKFDGIGVSVIPGIVTCNISFRAGGSGRTYQLIFVRSV